MCSENNSNSDTNNFLTRLLNVIEKKVSGPHCQSILIAALKNILSDKSHPSFSKHLPSICRHIVPTLFLYLEESATLYDIKNRTTSNIFTHLNRNYLPALSTEILQTLTFLTHVKLDELEVVSESVLTARNKMPAGLISNDTLINFAEADADMLLYFGEDSATSVDVSMLVDAPESQVASELSIFAPGAGEGEVDLAVSVYNAAGELIDMTVVSNVR